MKASEIIAVLNDFAPPIYQESYDNSGLQLGDANAEINTALLTLDITEAVLEESMERGCQMIIAHHPIIFSGLKSLTGRNYVERIVMKAIKNDIVLFAAHTNLDNMREGVNAMICKKLGLKNTSILQPTKNTLRKLYTYAPESTATAVREALFAAGAGAIGNYSECSFSASGTGTFKGNKDSNPTMGKAGGARENVAEQKIEVLFPKENETQILKALFAAHDYETVAYEIISLENENAEIGAGMIGYLERPMEEMDFLKMLKTKMQAACIRHTSLLHKPIQKVALCGGSGSFLLNNALAAGADVFITGDYKYHQFFDAEGRIVIADIGHYESEQFTPELMQMIIAKKLPNFATLLSETKTNPVNYFF
ncbi:MAG: Nif3-like dinuclear metal center hexameric protein [Chitinophagaceae bacterium]